MNVMSETRVRMVVNVVPEIRDVLKFVAADRGGKCTMGQLIEELVRDRYREELAHRRRGRKKGEAGADA